MTVHPALLIGLFAAALAAAASHFVGDDGPTSPLPEAAPRAAPFERASVDPAIGGPATADPASDPVGGWIAASLARPLFTPGRRPASAPAAAAAAIRAVAEPPRLTGILVSPGGRRAIFAGTDRSVVAGEGTRFGDFTVTAISTTQVTMLGPTGPRVLTPSFGPAPAATGGGVRTAAAGPGQGGRTATQAAAPGAPDAIPVPEVVPGPDPATEDNEEAFRSRAAPSGLDILRGAARGAPQRPGAAVPGVDQLGGLTPGRDGAVPGASPPTSPQPPVDAPAR